MPRKNYPANSRLIYAAFMRKTRDELIKVERKTSRRNKLLDDRQEKRFVTRERQAKTIRRRLEKIEKHPSKLGVARLKQYVTSNTIPAELRAYASDILLRWSLGEIEDERCTRRPRRGNQSLSA